MTQGWRVEQVFLRREAGRCSFLLVLEAPSGARRRETVPTPATAEGEAIDYLARVLARRGDVDGTSRLRVREQRAGRQADRSELARRLASALEDELAEAAD